MQDAIFQVFETNVATNKTGPMNIWLQPASNSHAVLQVMMLKGHASLASHRNDLKTA